MRRPAAPPRRCAFTPSRSSSSTVPRSPDRDCRWARRPARARGSMHQRPRDRDALQLAARQLARHARRARSARPTAASIVARARFAPRASRAPSSASGSATFCADRQIGQDVERLEHEADALAPQARSARRRRASRGRRRRRRRARVGTIEAGDQVEQRRLADARLAHDRDELALRDGERHIVEYASRPCAGEGFGQMRSSDHRGETTGARASRATAAMLVR